MAENTDPTMGGLDALVAAASSVAGQGKRRANRAANSDMDNVIDPALQNTATTDVADAMSVFLTNPAVVQLIAEYNAKKQHRQVSLYTQLLSGSVAPSTITPDTPVQQTRSGRISRPPVYPPPTTNPFQQFLNTQSTPNIPVPAPSINNDQTQIQAIKDALENVSTVHQNNHLLNDGTSLADAASYDALLQSVNNDPSSVNSRFWRNDNLLSGLPGWTGIEATTLAQAAASADTSSAPFGQRSLGHGLPNGKPLNADERKRSASVLDDTGDESIDSPITKRYKDSEPVENVEGLPEWPLPPTGKGGRKNMPREELLARRRARNRVAAQESRKKKKEFFGGIADQLKDRDQAYEQLHAHCKRLEQEVEALKKVILGAGLELPNDIPTPIDTLPGPTPGPSVLPTAEDTSFNIDSITSGLDLPFHDLFTIDDNDADDLDFIPPSSPKRGDSDSEDSDDEEDPTPRPISANNNGPGASNGRKSRRKANASESERAPDTGETPTNAGTNGGAAEGEGEGEGEAEDVEEDLFLPIEDVPIPPRDEEDQEKVMKRAMNELHVDTPQQLMGVIKKMVETAGYGGVTEEQVGMLSKLLALGQAQGMSIW
ncbi:uncharacterized protein I303_103467 [Kwoniella dejecticola CBS 10117]|uniref:BZIP domain-containing protein n=1 Tax=Kwoniella dejecticola CBS 10117 TaxID=1296121 RepID=A0A1A6A6W1_9TREE|nr:uncharacterized protein I303_03490 [Kwoniella dejecticola CBS 10117]OBR85778.1 hypothetical protein I303_03490 [Kwoniella dejecticola CBS 10117]